jgi:hypothetical protein
MAMQTCPTDVVRAPAERIWGLLTTPREVARWTATRLLVGPDRPMQAGDVVVFRKGPGLNVVFNVIASAPPTELTIDVALPLGIVNHEIVRVTPLADGQCRVTFS